MTGRSLQRRQLSRSKIDLFVECPRCLYLDVARGVRWKDDETGWTLFGAIDDLWLAASGGLIVADYKATARCDSRRRWCPTTATMPGC